MRWPDIFILSRTLKFKHDHEPVQQIMSSAASSYPGVLTEPGKGAPKNGNRIRGPRRKHSCPPGALVLSTEEMDVPSSTCQLECSKQYVMFSGDLAAGTSWFSVLSLSGGMWTKSDLGQSIS